MKLLLIEDDYLIGDGTRKALTREGFSVDWVQRVEDAAAAVKTQNYELIILDVRLPDGSGLSFLASLRKGGNKTPVLILTALNATPDRVRGLDLGADDYLVKPFDVSQRSEFSRRRSVGAAAKHLRWLNGRPVVVWANRAARQQAGH